MKRALGSIVVLLLLTACSSDKHASAPASASASATSTTRPPYTPVFAKGACNDEVPSSSRIECGTLTVPEDRSKVDGRKVVLPVAIVHTADAHPAPDPVVYFSGGPGYPGLTDAEGFLTNGQTGDRDVILFDQRGTGEAAPTLDCPEVHEATATILGAANSFAVEGKTLNDALLACRDRLRATGVDFNQYNTSATADDVADLRTAMGIKEWDLFGVSYGTTVALATMRAHPEGVRSVVIDSVLPTDVGGTAPATVDSFERVKRVFFDGCAADAKCHAAFPALEADTTAVIQQLDATPYHGSIKNPVLKRQTPITITGADAAGGLFNAFYDTGLIPLLPGIIEQLKSGTAGAIIDQLASQGIDFVDGAAEAETAAVDCADRGSMVHAGDNERALAAHPEDSTVLLFAAVSCADFGVAPAPKGFNDPVRSDIPTLVLGDEYDPVTPPEQSQHAAATLTHSTFVKFPGLGHGAVFSAPQCPEIIFRAFLAAPTATVDTSCVASMTPPAWSIPS